VTLRTEMATFLDAKRVRRIAMMDRKFRHSLPKGFVCIRQLSLLVATLAVVGATLLLSANLAHASGGEGQHSFSDLYPYWVNFILFALLLRYLLKDKITSGWAARRNSIETQVEAAQSEKKIAEGLLEESRRLLASVDSQIRAAKEQISKQAEFEVQEIGRLARDKATRTLLNAKESVEAGTRTALRSIRQELVSEALARATKTLREDAKSGSDARYRGAAAGNCSRLVN